MAGLTPGGRADAEAFLSRLVRLDPTALVRLRATPASLESSAEPGRLALWASLPWQVLVTRDVAVAGQPAIDLTVPARALLTGLDGYERLPRRDVEWRWPLPSGTGTVVERVPAAEIRRIGTAAAETLRTAGESGVGGRAVGERVLRDALLDHVPIVVEAGGHRVEVPQRLVQALLRMGFLGTSAGQPADAAVAVRVAGGWVGLAAAYGSAWRRSDPRFAVRTIP